MSCPLYFALHGGDFQAAQTAEQVSLPAERVSLFLSVTCDTVLPARATSPVGSRPRQGFFVGQMDVLSKRGDTA